MRPWLCTCRICLVHQRWEKISHQKRGKYVSRVNKGGIRTKWGIHIRDTATFFCPTFINNIKKVSLGVLYWKILNGTSEICQIWNKTGCCTFMMTVLIYFTSIISRTKFSDDLNGQKGPTHAVLWLKLICITKSKTIIYLRHNHHTLQIKPLK